MRYSDLSAKYFIFHRRSKSLSGTWLRCFV